MGVIKNTIGSYYLAGIIILISLVSITPILEVPRNIIMVILLASLAFIFNIGSKPYQENKRLVTCVILYFILIFFYRIIGYSDAAWGNYMTQVFSLMPVLLMLLIPQNIHNKLTLQVLCILFLIMLFNIANNIRLSIIYPELTLSNYARKEDILASFNMGGSYFQTFALFFFDVCLFLFLNAQKKVFRLLMLVCVIVSGVYVIGFCLKASVFIYLLLSIVLITVAWRSKTIWKTASLFSLVAFLIVLLFEENKDDIVNFLMANSPDERITVRLVTIIDPNSGIADERTITNRSDLWLLSLQTWLKNPLNFLFGIGDHRASFDVIYTGIGQHSDIFDTLARYGIIGGSLLYIIFRDSIKFVLRLFDKKLRQQIIMIMLIVVLCALTKSVLFACITTVVFLFIPLSTSVSRK